LLRSLPPAEASAQLVQNTVDSVQTYQKRRRTLRRRFVVAALGALAACLLVLVGAQAYYSRMAPTSYDVVVLGQQQLMASTKASLRVQVVDRGKERAPVSGVPVTVALLAPDGTEETLAEVSTDEQGSANPRFDLPDWEDGKYQLRIVAKPPSGAETLIRPIELKRSWKLMLSSDKPVYKPGQTIQLRSLALRKPDLKPIKGQTAVFTLADPKGNILFKHSEKTSDFGITSAECALAQEIEEGTYSIACKVGDTESKLSVEVKRYVLPKFKVEVRPDRPYYAPGQVVQLTVQGNYFTGKPVLGGKVEVKVITREAGERVLETLDGKTDEMGTARFKVTLPKQLVGTEQDRGDARVGFVATLTDSAEHKQTTLAQCLVTTRPVRVEAIPESGTLVRGVSNAVYLLVSRANGMPVTGAKVAVTGDDVKDEVTTDARGAAQFKITPRKESINWTISVRAKGGEVLARRHDTLTCGQIPDDFLVRPDRAVYRSGQTMKLTALGGGVEPVFVDFLKDKQTLLSEMIEMTNGKGEHTFDLPADLFGTIEVVTYRFNATGLAARKRRVIYVSPAEGLNIQATLDKGEYRPGRTANLHMALTDQTGKKPVRGAISLAAVDEAVFAVLAQRPGMEQTFYNLEEELLKPVYAIYPWMPGDEQATRRDQALFAATAVSTSGVGPGPAAPGMIKEDRIRPGMREQTQPEPMGRHTLFASSFPEKKEKSDQTRTNGLNRVRLGWIGLALGTVLLAYVSLWVFLSWRVVLVMHGVAVLVVVLVIPLTALLLLDRSVKMAPTAQRASGGRGEWGFKDKDKAVANDAKMMAPGAPPRGMVPEKEAPEARGGATWGKATAPAPRLRQYFPETLLWKPQLITDDQGRLPPLPIHLADSITTWRLSASAVSSDGRLGAKEMKMKVFQPLFVDLDLPVSLTRGDEVGVPVVVYNYLDKPQIVTLTLAEGDWFSLTGAAEQKIEIEPGPPRMTRFNLKVNRVGTHRLRVTAIAGEVSDAIEREIDVEPDGVKVEAVHSGSLDRPITHTLEVPGNAIEGSVKAYLKLYPSSFSQVVEGLDNIFRMPYGCFEQTSSTTYPNILALSYLRQTGQKSPKLEAKARQYIHLGYQRLVGFEVQGGGFEWFGRPPAHQTLTAYGLMEFEDMAKVHDVDPNLIARTRRWLLNQRKPDGAWEPDNRVLHDDVTGRDAKLARLGATAYIAWAVFGNNQAAQEGRTTLDFLLAHPARDINNDHVLALVCHALLSLDPTGKEASAYLQELARRATRSEDGKHVSWAPPPQARTLFHGGGDSARIETTAVAALALLRSSSHAQQARPALAWLITKKDANGTWHSTQATVLSLKALLAGTGKPLGDGARRVAVSIGGQEQEIVMPADQSEVMRLLDLSGRLKPGKNELALAEKTKTAAGYQVVFRYHVTAVKAAEEKKEPLSIQIAYDRTDLAVDETVRATATVTNQMKATAPMVMLDLPVPPGFAAETAGFAALVKDGSIARFQVRPRSVLVYLRGLEPDKPLKLTYKLRATMPVKATAGVARVYEYYDPSKEGTSPARRFTVRARE
jgi:hypothetical protein